ncbi:MAG: hypothetical protein F4X57_12665 [Chloroflexi bacterium]|nr:hypothetical protein [Chloroflexota bacterium]
MLTYGATKYFDVDPNQIIVDARSFASWRNGLPEWIKNSSDAYDRAGALSADRVIVVILAPADKDGSPVLACLDFVGMASDDLIDKLARYGDPEASGSGTHVVGGHGNGGKLFAVGGFKGDVVWRTIKHGFRSEYGLAEPGRPALAFVLDDIGEVKDRPCTDLPSTLNEWLSALSLSVADLPAAAQAAAQRADGVTLVCGARSEQSFQIHDSLILSALRSHPQCKTPLETTKLFVVANGKLSNGGAALTLEEIMPYEGFSEPLAVSIPPSLNDPFGQSPVSTTAGGAQGTLELRTSDKQMPGMKALQGRHTIDFKQGSRIRGSRSVRELVGKGPFTDRIYGQCRLDALVESYESQTRGPLVESPLVRALEEWVGEQILAYADKIQQASMVQDKATKDEEKIKRLTQQMAKLNRWINRIVDEISSGVGDDPGFGGGGKKTGGTRSPLPLAPVGRIAIAIDEKVAGAKVPLEFSTSFFGLDDVTQVRPVSVVWHSSNPPVAAYSNVTDMVNTYQPGTAEIWCESSTGVVSNRIELRVIDCDRIELSAATIDVPIGRRRHVWATGITAAGERHEGIRVNWTTDSSDILRVGLAGVISGLSEGTSTVTAKEGDGTAATCVVTVVPAPEGPGGPNRPRYLLSEVQKAPYDEEPPVFHKDSGLVTQRQVDIEHNIWWINLASPLARLVYDQHGEVSEQWAMYLGERIADAAIEAAMQGADRGVESRPVNEVLEEVSQLRMQILDSFTQEFGATKQLVL